MPFKNMKALEQTQDLFSPGHGLCAGCGAAQVARLVTKVAGSNTVVVNATGCVEVSTTAFPGTSWRTPYLHLAFENAAAGGSGVRAAYRALKRKRGVEIEPNVVVLAGDGGTADIGLQSLSGAFERGDRITYVCYDNEAYMNTGIQKSGTTPFGAWTSTTPGGHRRWKKDLMAIAIAHGVPYAATATIAYVMDAVNKVERALSTDGPSFIHWLQPCTAGWRFDSKLTVKLSRLAVQTGLWPLYEAVDGKTTVTVPVARRRPVIEYLKPQGRFRALLQSPEQIGIVQTHADELATKFGLGPVLAS